MIAQGGPLLWLDTLLGARNERLEAEVAAAQERARAADERASAAESEAAAATEAVRVAEVEAATLRAGLERAQAGRRAAATALAGAERRVEAMAGRVAQAQADRTWDLVRVLEAAVEECRREHGTPHA